MESYAQDMQDIEQVLNPSSGINPGVNTALHPAPFRLEDRATSDINPIQTAIGVYVAVHGHFYQPPRENPYLNAVERQPSAAPFHDWNERIHHECYRTNAFARILNDDGDLLGIVNNFEYFSFNIGPTLMSWLERYDLETYQRIIEADRNSANRLNGHGNAIAQVYNHIILPLATERDKYTQVRWGKADFRARFGRDPEGMWLAETAVDYPTLEVLIAEGIRFIILAPSQAQRCRPLSDAAQDAEWLEVGGSQIDPTRPYRCYLPNGDRSKDFIDIFFYDGPISRDMGFGEVLSSSHQFASRIGQAVRGDQRPSQLISVATDGETFGHHKPGREKAIAYAFMSEFPRRGWTVTNFAHYLSLNDPTWEVELKPVTAWSCCHGVDRWQDDCGCGGGGTWHQQWRRPLRDSLDWLRDQLAQVYEEAGRAFLLDPWQARDAYIAVIGDRSSTTIDQFFAQHQAYALSDEDKIDALRLLEMQRHALLMYTSCGWFFEEISRPEGTQILRYAARAIELAGDVTGVQLERSFVRQLAAAPSNVETMKNGAEVYRKLVIPSQINLRQVAAHYAISSLFTTYSREQRIYCYTIEQQDYQLQRIGVLALAVGQIQLTSEITRESVSLTFAVLHLGGWDFHCCIQPFAGRRVYSEMKEALFEALKQAGAANVILAMTRLFGEQSYSLHNLFAEERHRIMHLLCQENLTRLDQLYTQVYRDNYGVLMAFHRDELEVPQELQVAAEVALSHRIMSELRSLDRDASDLNSRNLAICDSRLAELEAAATEADYMHCQLKLPQGKQILEDLIWRSLHHLFYQSNPASVASDIQWLEKLLHLGQNLRLGISLDRAQELYLTGLNRKALPQLRQWQHLVQIGHPAFTQVDIASQEPCLDLSHIQHLLQLGKVLKVDVTYWLQHLDD
jgi:alpha-amylase/alpha-mannosidase (GH57 family)